MFSAGTHHGAAGRPFPELTGREFEVLDQMAAGRSNSDIAECLFLSEKTVRNLVSMVFTKLHVPNRAQAIVRGARPASAAID
ncbi:helix-turn-helix transcriptional regulator [Actinoplanes sp. Pm04-4]|uniref:Helix-turn-helix transcriptional regulator n=1 Tax=Paractinoplanes pyxinae TaxID=2997416 RepID=A0ABT4AUY3_9ACTN|nr:helix-turn-helix transcriptional regulator [Actinoplanes pyxinae]MCY1138044.1 helix-turn-helix transcriptional regulator [Actinoplanes pyxinae]